MRRARTKKSTLCLGGLGVDARAGRITGNPLTGPPPSNASYRRVVRRTWLADVLFVLILSLPSVSSPASVPVTVLAFAADVWILRRFGLLALVAMLFAQGSVQNVPLVAASWYTALSLTTPLLIAAAAAWALYVIVTSRPGTASRPASEASM